jgi:hypothetical protein
MSGCRLNEQRCERDGQKTREHPLRFANVVHLVPPHSPDLPGPSDPHTGESAEIGARYI